jgi:hypothetical protein
MVWGAVTAIAAVAHLTTDKLFEHYREIEHAVECGSVITQDRGIAALAVVASHSDRYRKAIFPFLLKHLQTCRPKDIPQRSEKSLVAADRHNRSHFTKALRRRLPSLTPSQQTRVAKVIKRAESI